MFCAVIMMPAQGEPQIERQAGLVKPGVVIEKFEDEVSGAKRAGMKEGDVVLRWSRGEASGKFESPFDVTIVEGEQLRRGPVKIEGLRGTETRTWTVSNQWWGAQMRPNFAGTALADYLHSRALADQGNTDQAVRQWRKAAAASRGKQPIWLGSWFLLQGARQLAEKHRWKEADALYEEAIQQAQAAKAGIRGQLRLEWGNRFYRRSEWDSAVEQYLKGMKENLVAGNENAVSANLGSLGMVEKERGNLGKAEEYLQRASEISHRLEPGNLQDAEGILNLGLIASDRGDLARSERYFLKALGIYQKKAPISVGTAFLLNNLGDILLQRGDPERAEEYFRKSLALIEKLYAGTPEHATIIGNLARTVARLGDTRQAENLLRQALAIRQKAAPGGWGEAQTRHKLGELAQLKGDWADAEKIYLKTLSLREKWAPGSVFTAETLDRLGDVTLQAGDMAKAEEYYRRALRIQEKRAPGSEGDAESLAALGGILQRKQQFETAEQYYSKALEALERQTAMLGGSSEGEAIFRAKHQNYYREYAELLLREHKTESALEIVERSRARALLETLGLAHVDIRRGVDPALLKQERSIMAEIKAKNERRAKLLSDKGNAEQAKTVEKEISDLTSEHQILEGQIRTSSPAFTALTEPQPLTAKEIQQLLLDQHTLLLEYSLGEKHSHVFAVTPDSLQVFELPGRAQVERQARQVYSLLTARNQSVRGESFAQRQKRWRRADAAYQREARALSRMILGPVAAQMKDKRLLIVADGALYYIPFAALPEPDRAKKSSLPLAVNHEVVSLPSASVLALLRQQDKDRKPAPQAVAVLADPVFDKHDPRVSGGVKASAQPAAVRSAKSQSGEGDSLPSSFSARLLTRSAVDLGLRRNGQLTFSRLPYTRQEADAIRAVTPASKVLEAVDFRASRAMATSPELAKYRIVHFATHGLLNNKHPELSGLVLSLVDKQGKPRDGFLTLQDIYNMNLSADLVVLSACETGLGKEISGEGLIGMTRGFMYAGASRVVASLWNVSDVATARLMADFYREMEEDKRSPAAALRAAQVKMWKQQRWRSPYYWAAFQIQGEWR